MNKIIKNSIKSTLIFALLTQAYTNFAAAKEAENDDHHEETTQVDVGWRSYLPSTKFTLCSVAGVLLTYGAWKAYQIHEEQNLQIKTLLNRQEELRTQALQTQALQRQREQDRRTQEARQTQKEQQEKQQREDQWAHQGRVAGCIAIGAMCPPVGAACFIAEILYYLP